MAADDPDAAAAILVAQNPGVFDANPALPKASQEFLAAGGYLRDAAGAVGRQTLAEWQGYSGFLYDQRLLTGPDGKPLSAAARLRGAVHATTTCRDRRPAPAVAAGGRRSCWSA